MLSAIPMQALMSLLVWNWFHFSFEFQFTILHSCKSSNSSQLFKLGPKNNYEQTMIFSRTCRLGQNNFVDSDFLHNIINNISNQGMFIWNNSRQTKNNPVRQLCDCSICVERHSLFGGWVVCSSAWSIFWGISWCAAHTTFPSQMSFMF